MKNNLHKLFFFSFLLLFASSLFAQRNMRPTKRKDVFGGARDFSSYKPVGFQLSFGPTVTLTSLKNETQLPDSTISGDRFRFIQDPSSRLGVHFDIGLAHYPMKTPRFTLFGNRLLSYYDWGLGIRVFGGRETTTVEYMDASGQNVISQEQGKGAFYNTYGSARFAIHNNYYFVNNKHFIDNGLGINGDYRIVDGNRGYNGIHFPSTQRFQKELAVNLHYDLGFGWKMRRGYYVTVGAQLPLIGFYEWRNGNPSLDWFSSRYYPVLLKAKFIWLFKDKSSSCNSGSEEDRKRDKEYQQNR